MDTGIYPMWDRFGFNYENGEAWSAICRIMLQENLEFVGLHTRITSYNVCYTKLLRSIGENSWCYVTNWKSKTSKSLIQDLIDIVSKNGNLLLNMGPKADGTIPDDQQQRNNFV